MIDEDRDTGLERLKDLASEAPVIRLVNTLITRAVEMRASDIHIEATDKRLRVRYRIDGMLHDQDPPPLRLCSAIVSRIKTMARLYIAERRLHRTDVSGWRYAAKRSISASPSFLPSRVRA
jgi:general secretion pathway protein E